MAFRDRRRNGGACRRSWRQAGASSGSSAIPRASSVRRTSSSTRPGVNTAAGRPTTSRAEGWEQHDRAEPHGSLLSCPEIRSACNEGARLGPYPEFRVVAVAPRLHGRNCLRRIQRRCRTDDPRHGGGLVEARHQRQCARAGLLPDRTDRTGVSPIPSCQSAMRARPALGATAQWRTWKGRFCSCASRCIGLCHRAGSLCRWRIHGEMKALVYTGPEKLEYREEPDATPAASGECPSGASNPSVSAAPICMPISVMTNAGPHP
jgi:hypothetical protein